MVQQFHLILFVHPSPLFLSLWFSPSLTHPFSLLFPHSGHDRSFSQTFSPSQNSRLCPGQPSSSPVNEQTKAWAWAWLLLHGQIAPRDK